MAIGVTSIDLTSIPVARPGTSLFTTNLVTYQIFKALHHATQHLASRLSSDDLTNNIPKIM